MLSSFNILVRKCPYVCRLTIEVQILGQRLVLHVPTPGLTSLISPHSQDDHHPLSTSQHSTEILTSNAMSERLLRTRRAPTACSWCRRRKVRCDATIHGSPCTRCRQDGRSNCVLRTSFRQYVSFLSCFEIHSPL